MLDAGGPLVLLHPRRAQVAVIGEEGHEVDLHAAVDHVLVLLHHDAVGAHRVGMLLLAGDLARVAAGAEVVIDQ